MANLDSLNTKQLYDLCLKIIDHKEKSHTYRSEPGEPGDPGKKVKMYQVRPLMDTRDRTYEATLQYKKTFEVRSEQLQKLAKEPEVEGRIARFVHGPADIAADIREFLRQDASALIEVLNKSQQKYEKLADEVLEEAKPHHNPERRPRHP